MVSASLGFFRSLRTLLFIRINELKLSCSSSLLFDMQLMKRTDHGTDVAILENLAWSCSCSGSDDIHHRSGQVVNSDHLIGKQSPKYWVDSSHQAVAEIRLLARLHGVDVGGPKNVKSRKSRGEENIFGLSLITCKSHAALPRRVRAIPTQERERRVGAAAAENSRELDRVVHSYPAELRV